nr:hypothetical protein [Streptomyces leeuwenhoekii]
MDASTGFVRNFVGRILHELEELTVTVSALRDAAFSVGMFGDETGVHGISLQNPVGLFEDGFDHR